MKDRKGTLLITCIEALLALQEINVVGGLLFFVTDLGGVGLLAG